MDTYSSINNLTIPNPLVSPDLPTTYYTSLTDPFGCINRDSVFVDVKAFVTINAGNDTIHLQNGWYSTQYNQRCA
jgi:hypothetical protein